LLFQFVVPVKLGTANEKSLRKDAAGSAFLEHSPRQIVLAAQPGGNFLAAWRFLRVSAIRATPRNGRMF
jgi:hypothetical protein